MATWDAQKSQRLKELRGLPDPPTAAQQAELDALMRELEAFDAVVLNDATRRVRQERDRAEQRVRALELLAARRGALVERTEKALQEARAERQAIESELASVLGAGAASKE